ncbi:hypothetical protein K461DRAFT_280381 [Myriangium duriaei CBS 260.36]|uniref:Uncharacterized protein n=1 Tax=Myriangium duriaei CBS 260.36 TaxID=1168546 RepID=A0A9P4MEP2_9PEZI|nr:hypothetical protein K461DRAFT_280381 [Myriangium duriaei CBS 260.36]
MFSKFGRSRPVSNDAAAMFSAIDIKHILNALPPPGHSEDLFSQSLAGESLVSLASAKSNLQKLIDDREHVSIKDLPHLLDIQDISSLVAWADGQPAFSTASNGRPSLPPWIQKTIAIRFFAQARHGFINVYDEERFWSLPAEILEEIVRVYSTSFGRLQETEGYFATPQLVKKTKDSLLQLCREAEAEPAARNLSLSMGQIPREVLHELTSRMQAQSTLQRFEVQFREDGVWFVPVEAIARQSEQKQKTTLADYAQRLSSESHCIITEQGTTATDIVEQLIGGSDSTTDDDSKRTVQLVKHPSTAASDWPSSTILIKQHLLTRNLDIVLAHIPSAVTGLWNTSQPPDSTFTPAVQSLLSPSPSPLLSALLLSTSSQPVREAYTAEHTSLLSRSTISLYTHLQMTLFHPLFLYTAPLNLPEVLSDSTLAEHQQSFLLSHVKDSLLPTVLDISALSLPPPQALRTELSRFATTATGADSLDALLSASRRLGRKTRPSTLPPASTAGDEQERVQRLQARDEAVTTLLARLGRTKRASDVLQQVAWVLLAAVSTEVVALWVSAGRDAGRVVKCFGRFVENVTEDETGFGWKDAARRLEDFRGKVKDGKQSEADVEVVRELARRGWEGRRCRA